MPAWEIAHLADGWADGKGFGGKTGYVTEASGAFSSTKPYTQFVNPNNSIGDASRTPHSSPLLSLL